jgi:hypothetical protein
MSAIAGTITTGIETRELLCKEQSPVLGSSAPANLDVMIQYSKVTIDNLNQYRLEESITISHEKGAELERLDWELTNAYKGVDDFKPPATLSVPRP